MTIETKFNYKDTVWFMLDNKAVQGHCNDVVIECKYKGGSASWGQPDSFPIIITYTVCPNSYVGGISSCERTEDKLFASREQLLKTI